MRYIPSYLQIKMPTDVPLCLSAKYYPSLDGLRGIAILSVILRHISFDETWGVWIDGTVGIHIFFILSGFLITTLLLKEYVNNGTVSLRNFYIRRTLRIFPVAYLYILSLIILSHVFGFNLSNKSILTSIFYLKNFPIAGDWYTGHFWSLSVEEQFYLIFPVLLISNLSRYVKICLILFIVVPIIDYIGFNNIGIVYSIEWVHLATFGFLALFDQGTLYILAGSLLSILLFSRKLNLDRFKNNRYISLLLFVTALIVHFSYVFGSLPFLSSTVFTILITLVIGINLYENNLLTDILKNPLLTRLGILSYSLYIWQQLFTANPPWKSSFRFGDSLLFNLAALLIVATCSHYLFEKQFLKLKSRFYK